MARKTSKTNLLTVRLPVMFSETEIVELQAYADLNTDGNMSRLLRDLFRIARLTPSKFNLIAPAPKGDE